MAEGSQRTTKLLWRIGLLRQARNECYQAAAPGSGDEDVAARLRSAEHVEEIRRPMRRNAPETRSARDSGKGQKGARADCALFGRPIKCKIRLSRFYGPVFTATIAIAVFTIAAARPDSGAKPGMTYLQLGTLNDPMRVVEEVLPLFR